jgi:hypothetical protein
MPTDQEIREKARRDAAQELVSWATGLAPNANLALLARLVVAIEALETTISTPPTGPRTF